MSTSSFIYYCLILSKIMNTMDSTAELLGDGGHYNWPLFKAASGLLAITSAILFAFLLYQTIKFLRIYGFSSKWLVLFFLMLNLYIIMKIAYFVDEILQHSKSCNEAKDKWIDGVLSGINIEIFVSAVWFNIFNWLYQVNDINDLYLESKFSKWTLDIILILWQLFLLAFIAVHFSLFWYIGSNDGDYHYWLAYPSSILLMISSVVFIIVALHYYKTLKSFSIKKAMLMK